MSANKTRQRYGGFERAGTVLQRTHGELRPPSGILLYERRNGHFKLQITGHPEFGLPYGQDRLIPIFLATLAVRQQSQTVRFKSGATILEMFGLAKGGKEYRRVVAAFERIFGATIFFGTAEVTAASKVVHRARFNFMREARIWYEGPKNEENVVVLCDEFFAEVMAHPIPADLKAITLLAASPGALDLFLWLISIVHSENAAIDSAVRSTWFSCTTRLHRILSTSPIRRKASRMVALDRAHSTRL